MKHQKPVLHAVLLSIALTLVPALIPAVSADQASTAAQGRIRFVGVSRAGPAVPVTVGTVRPVPEATASKDDESFLGQIIVYLQPGTDPVAFGCANGLTYLDTLKSDCNAHIYLSGTREATRSATASLSASPLVRKVFENRRSRNTPDAFVPNDPYFHANTPAPAWPGQWHLVNEWVSGLDVNVGNAWLRDMTGLGVKMAVVDDCLQKNHPDLAPNYNGADSWDFGQGDADPSPVNANDGHGVSTAGLAAARGGNGKGVTGAAPYAKIACERVDFPTQTDAMFVDATLYHSSGSDTSIKIKNHSYGVLDPYIDMSAQRDAMVTSTDAGTIHVMSAGNNRQAAVGDANTKMMQADPASVTVAAIGSDGAYAYYSAFGANVFCTAPSNGSMSTYRITTTDRTGVLGYNSSWGDTFPDLSYVGSFTGTSASSAIVAGVLALAKQVQPELNTRFAKHLLARTCKIVDAGDSSMESDGGWKMNGAGLFFNQNYGFGLVDAHALCEEARKYSGVTAPFVSTIVSVPVNVVIPDGDATGVRVVFATDGTFAPMEEISVYLDITHSFRGDIQAYLTSPRGTTSRLVGSYLADGQDDMRWWFTSNAFWGEDPNGGDWVLRVADIGPRDVGTWNSVGISMHCGSLVEETSPLTVTIDQLPTQADPAQGTGVFFAVHFNKWVEDFDAGDVYLGGTAGATTATIYSGAGRDYVVRVSGMTLHGTVTATIYAGAAHDGVATPNDPSTSSDNEITWNFKPRNLYISPNTGVLVSGVWKTLSSAYDDYNGADDILKAYLLLNNTNSQVNGACMQYDFRYNKLYLKNDAGTSWGVGYAPGSNVTLSNSQVYLDVKNTTVAVSGKNLVVKWRIKPRGTFPDTTLHGYQLVQDTGFLSTGWQVMGIY